MDAATFPTQPTRNPEADGQGTAARPSLCDSGSALQGAVQSTVLKKFNDATSKLREALRANNLSDVDNLISEFVARGYTIHQLSDILHDAIIVDNAEFAEKLIRRQIVFTDSYVYTAVKKRSKRCLELFFRYHVNINKPECQTRPPIWRFAAADREMVYWLVEHGADLNVHAEHDFATVMSSVVKLAPTDLVRDLLDDRRHLVDVFKGDLLHHALNRKTDVVLVLAMLLDHGAPIDEGLYARHLASQNMYCFMPRGPPLHYAAEEGQLDAVCFLLSRHADVSIRDTQNKTALLCAQKKGHTEIAEVLQKAMAEFKTQHL